MEKIEITTEMIKLEQAIKLSGVTSTGGEAKLLIKSGAVKVNGEVCSQRARKLYSGDKLTVSYGDEPEYFVIEKA
ncbi:MAG: RNA-binding S4 domain-containing protein [Clostridia bacterium]|nr:RNA-binding S4 domain-containing protein [Clostridia bacterium]